MPKPWQNKSLKFTVLIGLTFILQFFLANSSKAAWYDTAWPYRVQITLNGDLINGSLTNFPVYLDLSRLPGDFFDHVNADGSDIRVTRANGSTLVAREIVKINTTSNAGELHFLANSLTLNTDKSFYIYYGNPQAKEPTANSQYGRYNVWNGNYYYVYHYNAKPFGLVKDSTKYQTTGSSTGYMNGNNFIAGMVGNGYSFDGSNDYIFTKQISSFSSQSYFSMSAWAKRSATNQNIRIGGHTDTMSNPIGISSSGGSIYGYVDSSTNYVTVASNDTSWHHLFLVFDGSGMTDSDKLKLYLDGSTTGNSTMGTIPSMTGWNFWTMPLRLGSLDGSSYHKGSMDEVRIALKVFTGGWVKTEYNNQNTPSYFLSSGAEETKNGITAIAFNPPDNGYSLKDDNFVITFSKIVDIQTGNITIKKASDNSTVETISVASGQVSGNGTRQVTINPSVTLTNGTAYYIQIDSGAIKDQSANSYAGISNTSTWSFTTAAWYNSNWAYRVRLKVDKNKVPGDLSNYSVYVNLNHLPGHFFDYVRSDGGDIRVTLANGLGLVPREIVSINTTANAGEMHFKSTSTLSSSSDTTFFIYYGNSEAIEPTANSQFGKYNVWNGTYSYVYHLADKPFGIINESGKYQAKAFSQGAMNGTHSIAGIMDNGNSFDGSNDYITTPSISIFNSASKFTISSWAKRASSGEEIRMGQYGNMSDELGISSTSTTIKGFNSTSNSQVVIKSNDTDWHHLALVFNGSMSSNGERLTMYFNGNNLLGSASTWMDSTTGGNFTSYPFYIGRLVSGGYHQGSIDEIRLTTKALSQDWVTAEFNNQNSPSTFYSVTSVYDLSNMPTPIAFDPPDNGYGDRDQNLVITFNRPVTVQTGNIFIKKGSDNSTIETIDVAGIQVTGTGTAQITINPTTSLTNGTAYYVQIASGAFRDASSNSYTGISDTSTWNFTTAQWYNSGWAYRVKLTVDHDKVPADLSNFPVYVNLNHLPGHFFDNVKSDGSDIRVSLSNGIGLVPREIVSINTTANAGEMHFQAKGTLSSTTDTTYYVYYGNNETTEPTANSQFGKYNVWNGTYYYVYHLGEKPFGKISDSAKYQYSGFSQGAMNGTHSIAGMMDNGVSFDGSNDYISISGITVFSSASRFTLSSWVKRASSGEEIRMGQYSNMGSNEIAISSTSTQIRGYIDTMDSVKVNSNDTNWHHVAMVFNGSKMTNGERLAMYFDGSDYLRTAALMISSTIDMFSTYPFNIGTLTSGGYYQGRADEVRMTNKALSPDWVLAEYNNQYSPSTFYTVDSNYSSSSTPSVVAFDPADNGYGDKSQNLIINFNRAVSVQTGNITIKKTSGDTTIETIDVTSGQVTGTGTSQITINPSTTLVNGTAYYVQIDATAFDDLSGNSYAGISDTSTWNFTIAGWYNGSWLYRLKLTVDHDKVAGNLTSFPVYVNLANLPDHFFDNVRSDGGDIRVTLTNGLGLVPRQIVRISTSANAGEMHFKASGTLSSTADTDYYIYYGNSSATEPTASSSFGEQKVWNGIYSYVYHLGDTPTGSGQDINDTSSFNADGHSNGTMSAAATGQVDKGLTFDGSDDMINLGIWGNFSSASKFSLSSWVKRNGSGYNIRLGQYYSMMSADTSITSTSTKITASTNTSGSASPATSSVNSNDTNWHHVIMVFNGSGSNGDRLKFYFDGTSENSTTSTDVSSTTAMNMGGMYLGYSESSWSYHRGMIDETRVTSKAISPNWALTEYRNQYSPSTFYSIAGYSPRVNPDTTNPTVSTLSPADNATGISISTNLVITFDENIDIQTGNITIKKTSDNSTIQTIDVTTGAVTGNGTTQITINPSDLAITTEYYVLIDATAFDDTSGNSYAGIASTTAWSFTTSSSTGSNAMFWMHF